MKIDSVHVIYSLVKETDINQKVTCSSSISEFLCDISLVAQLVKNLPAVWEAWVRYLGWEGPLEKEKATHSSILAT